MNWFITGTDTNCGKTYFTCLLLRALREQGMDAVGMKPLCCGERDDVREIWEASGKQLSLDAINPVWLRPPVAPYTAAMIEERGIDPNQIISDFHKLRSKFPSVIVEGAGGWRVPILRDYEVSDLAVEMKLPVVIVVKNQLGCINHTLLTVESIQVKGLECAGLVINHHESQHDIAQSTNVSILEELTGLPILFELQPNQQSLPPIALA